MHDPEQAASAFRQRHGLGNAPLKDVAQIIEEFHLAWVMQAKLPGGLEARTIHNVERHHTLVCVGTSDNPERQRFTLAHELGHLEAGTLSADVHNAPDANDRPEERWAHNFARNLLLPLDAISGFLRDTEPDGQWAGPQALSDVVRTFGVSPKVALIQLERSGLVPKRLIDQLKHGGPEWSSARLAQWYGWTVEREQAVSAAQAPRRPAQLMTAAITGYVTGRRSLEEVAHVSGAGDIAAFQSILASAGILPPDDTPGVEDGFAHDDLGDLFGEGE